MVSELELGPINVGEYASYLEGRTRPNTSITYVTAIQEYNAFLDGRLPTRGNAQEFIDFLASHDKAPNTLVVKANAIRRWFRWKGQPIELDVITPHIAPPKYVTEDELQHLISLCQSPLETALIVGMFDTGCRVSEWINITTHDIDWEQGLVKVTRKGGRVTWVNISEPCAQALEAWLNLRKSANERVFNDLDPWMAWKIVKDVGQRAGIDLHPHMLRHSRAVQMLMAGADPYVVQQHLSHVNISTTMDIYGQLLPTHLKKKIPAWNVKGGNKWLH